VSPGGEGEHTTPGSCTGIPVTKITHVMSYEKFYLLGDNAVYSGESTDLSEEHVDSIFRVEE
jgi:hypothetical protein